MGLLCGKSLLTYVGSFPRWLRSRPSCRAKLSSSTLLMLATRLRKRESFLFSRRILFRSIISQVI